MSTDAPTAPGSDRHERPRDRMAERLDALEAQARVLEEQARTQRELIEELRHDVDDSNRGLAELRTELRSVAAGQGKLADQIGGVQVSLRSLVAQIADPEHGLSVQVQRIASRVPSGAVLATAGAGGVGLGLGSVATILYAVAQALGWLPG